MADALARRTEKGDRPLGRLTPTQMFRFLEKYEDADQAVKDATNARKDLREQIKGEGVPLTAWDRFRKNRGMSGEIRSKSDAAYLRLLEWDNKPSGYSPELGLGEDGRPLPLKSATAAKIDLEGLEAGKAKWNRQDNPYTPGTEEFTRWDTAWLRGQAQIASTLTDDQGKKAATLGVIDGGKSGEPGSSAGPRRGRPPGTGKKQREADEAAALAAAGGEQQQEGGEQQQEGGGDDVAGDPPPDAGAAEEKPAGDPPADEGEQSTAPGGADRYGQEWPSQGGNGSGSTH